MSTEQESNTDNTPLTVQGLSQTAPDRDANPDRVDEPAAIEVSAIANFPANEIHPSLQSVLKRGIDVVGSLVGLMITGILFIPIALAIQLDNPGPIFYSQMRCGVRGKPFRIWKFRSMIPDAARLKHLVNNEAKGGIFKNKNDPRITRVGRFLRRTSLDELPQFWNVLRGEMSLVGTRPPTIDEVLTYKPHHWARLNVKPGITGEWQVNGRSNVTDFEDVVKMDIAYQETWSVVRDIRLLLRTVQMVLVKNGAY